MATKVLAVKHLSVGYQNLKVAHNITFQLDQGVCCAIVGINGVGKSTLLRTLGGLQPALDGQVHINQMALGQHSALQLAQKVAVVLTDTIGTKNLSVLELIALGRQPYTNWMGSLTQTDHAKIMASLQSFQLEDLKDRKCYQLSDGQLQRVLMARAMAQDTPIILLDEPTTHLDLAHKVNIFKLLQQLAHKHQKTILFTTHEIDLAIQLCDKMLVLDRDQNPFGSPCELITQGAFAKLFPPETVAFDKKTGTFKVVK